LLLALLLTLAACAAPQLPENSLPHDPTPEAYVARSQGRATVVPSGQFVLDGRRVTCAGSPTVLDPNLDDYAIAYPRFIVVNPTLMNRVATPVKLWIYAHECGHVVRGWDQNTGATRVDTAKADCFGVQRGRRDGWLTPQALNQICKFIGPGPADSMHSSGPERCEAMRKCYAKVIKSNVPTR
jgi:hypothetical protein